MGFSRSSAVVALTAAFSFIIAPYAGAQEAPETSTGTAAPAIAATTSGHYRSVVQVISYEYSFGAYPRMLGWGSASVLDANGNILSNNHVVEAENWDFADGFGVCVTLARGERPDCRYTATLVSRDQRRDLSMLRIDPTDVYGNPVDFSRFDVMTVADGGIPESRESVVAIGYPWVGAGTMSETRGIISGTTRYNGATYLKTDALIAGGNSGGALVNGSGNLVGVPTFRIGSGEGGEGSLGYALWIGDAAEFIKAGRVAESQPEKNSPLPAFRRQIEESNKNHRLDDPLVTIPFPASYEVRDYVAGSYVDLRSLGEDDSDLESFSIHFVGTPPLTSGEERMRFLRTLGIREPESSDPNPYEIGGISFYQASDPTSDPDTQAMYGFLNEQTMVLVNVSAAFSDVRRSKALGKSMEDLFAGISFNRDPAARVARFSLPALGVDLGNSKFMGSNVREGALFGYLGTPNEAFMLNVAQDDSGSTSASGMTFDEYYRSIVSGSSARFAKAKIGKYDAVVGCSDVLSEYGPFSEFTTDMSGALLENMSECKIEIYGLRGKNGKTYQNSVFVAANKKVMADRLALMGTILARVFGQTSSTMGIPPMFAARAFVYPDLADQADTYKQKISWLLDHELLRKDRVRFDPMHPMRWGEFIDVYLRFVYRADTLPAGCAESDWTCRFSNVSIRSINPEYAPESGSSARSTDSVFRALGIDYDAYVPADAINRFGRAIDLSFAGVNVWKYTDRELDAYMTYDETFKNYRAWRSKVEDFYGVVFPLERRKWMSEILPDATDYQAPSVITLGIDGDLRIENVTPSESTGSISLAASAYRGDMWYADVLKTRTQLLTNCANRVTTGCIAETLRNEATVNMRVIAENNRVRIAGKAEAIDWIMKEMDAGIYDAPSDSGSEE